MNNYIKLDLVVLDEIGEVIKALIICFLLNQSKEIDRVKTQKWKQKFLAEMLKVNPKTVSRALKELKDNGYIDYEKQVCITKIILKDKALKWHISNFSGTNIRTKSPHHNANTSKEILSTDKQEKEFTKQEIYLKYLENNQ